MIIPIIGRSALEFWLGPFSSIYTNYAYDSRQGLTSFPTSFNFLVTAHEARFVADRLGLTLPIQTFSFNHNHHQLGKCCHVLTKYVDFPENSFVKFKLGKHEIYIASPEFCFLQASKKMNVPNLVNLGIQLCSLYYLQSEIKAEIKKNDGRFYVQKTRVPLTNIQLLQKYILSANGEHGIKKARIALHYVVECANSPMEAVIATMMICPSEFGGYGLPRFTMNEELHLTNEAAAFYQYGMIRGDFYWQKQSVVTEYNSRAFHMDAQQQAKDANRMNAMQRSGLRVIPMTFDNIKNVGAADEFMKYLMDALKLDDQKLILDSNREMRKKLWSELLDAKSNYELVWK